MIIEQFQETVKKFPDHIAINSGNKIIKYKDLDNNANQIANALIAERTNQNNNNENNQVGLLLEHGSDMIVAVIGTLTANQTYVPLDVTYPENRLAFMLENSEALLLITNYENLSLAQRLVKQTGLDIKLLNVEKIYEDYPKTAVKRKANGDSPAYILYTSGSTGRPKGVVQNHRNVLYYVRNWIERFTITDVDRMTLFSAFSHDGAAQDIFAALLSGACLYPYNIKAAKNTYELYTLLMKEEISIWHSVPSLFRFFTNTLTVKDYFSKIRWVLLGGEPLRAHDLELFKNYFPQATLANVYGQTESSVTAICKISRDNTFDDVSIGEALDHTQILLIGENGELIESMGVGEIVVSCQHIALGYWKNEEITNNVFTDDEDLGRLYWTGDLGRLTAEETIVMMGRKDFQVKIRGFRVETGEIESQLMRHKAVQEAVVTIKEDDKEEHFLCAYIVTNDTVSAPALREFLSRELPEYMIPRHFIALEHMPTTPTGKIDRNQLPEPGNEMIAQLEYEPPSNEIERKLVAIWQELLQKEKISISDNIIEMGGHSLLVISFISRAFQELKVDLQLKEVFDNPTVKELARLIAKSTTTLYSTIETAEEKCYYPATPDQFRIFALCQMENVGVTYNITGISLIEGVLDFKRFEEAFQTLLQRHEVLRTSFQIIGNELVQKIHPDIDFIIPFIHNRWNSYPNQKDIQEIVKNFILPFDLSNAPLFRSHLEKLAENQYLFLLDVHHIISDGLSQDILINEFSHLYLGEELPPLQFRYRDYSEWLFNRIYPQQLKKMETYWLDVFKDEIPVLKLPYNYPRPEAQSYEGDIVIFQLDKVTKLRLNQSVKETDTTLYMIFLAIYNVLLHKYSGQEDIVVGAIHAGRNQVEFENIVGFFVKTLALRNYPAANKTFTSFLAEIKQCVLNGLENQLYPFDLLVEKLNANKNKNQPTPFNTSFVLQNTDTIAPEKTKGNIELKMLPQMKTENRTVMFDLQFEVFENQNGITCSFDYSTKLFKRETIELMSRRFVVLINTILNNMDTKIQDLDYSIEIEKKIAMVQDVEFDL